MVRSPVPSCACSAAASALPPPACGACSSGQALRTALLFPLQQREHRKQRTEQEPCGESRGCRGPAEASICGGTRAVVAAVLGRKGGAARAVYRGNGGAPSRPLCWDRAALHPQHGTGASAGRGCGRETWCWRGPGCPVLGKPQATQREKEASVRIFPCIITLPLLVLLHPKGVLFLGPLES